MKRKRAILMGMVLYGVSLAALAAGLEVSGAYVRAVPPGQPNSAGFMNVTNTGDRDLALVDAESDVAKVVELHTHINDNGMMRMRRIERIPVPAGATVQLKPGGHHVMFIGLKRQLKPGEMVTITLVADDGSRTTVEAPVKMIQMGMPMKGHGMGKMKNPCAMGKPMQ